MTSENTTKTCSACLIAKPLDAFYKHPRSKFGRDPTCKACKRTSSALYRDKNREKIRAWFRSYERSAEYKEWQKVWLKEYCKTHKKDPAKVAAYNKQYYLAAPHKSKERVKKFYDANPDRLIAYAHRRRARLRGSGGSYTKNELLDLFRKQNWRCVYCAADISTKYNIDHIIPLVRGGSNLIGNIQLLCKPCNLSKGGKDPIEYELFIGHRRTVTY